MAKMFDSNYFNHISGEWVRMKDEGLRLKAEG